MANKTIKITLTILIMVMILLTGCTENTSNVNSANHVYSDEPYAQVYVKVNLTEESWNQRLRCFDEDTWQKEKIYVNVFYGNDNQKTIVKTSDKTIYRIDIPQFYPKTSSKKIYENEESFKTYLLNKSKQGIDYIECDVDYEKNKINLELWDEGYKQKLNAYIHDLKYVLICLYDYHHENWDCGLTKYKYDYVGGFELIDDVEKEIIETIIY